MLPGKRDADGRLYVTGVAVDATTTYQGGIPISPLGQVHITPNAPQTFKNGFGTVNAGPLSTDNAAIVTYLEGLPRTASGGLRVQLNTVPAATDPFIGGLRVGTLGGVYITDAIPP